MSAYFKVENQMVTGYLRPVVEGGDGPLFIGLSMAVTATWCSSVNNVPEIDL